jgi:hypothetical protein
MKTGMPGHLVKRDRREARVMENRLAFSVTSPAPREAWWHLYRTDPEALPSQSPAWVDCMHDYGGYEDASRYYEFSNGQRLLLPLVRRNNLPPAFSFHSSFPLGWSVGGVIAERPACPEELRAVLEDLGRAPGLAVSMLPNPRQGSLWGAAQPPRERDGGRVRAPALAIPRRAHVIELTGSYEQIYGELFSKSTRGGIRRALRAGVTVEYDTSGALLPELYELRRRSVERWAQQQNEPRRLALYRAERLEPLRKLEHLARSLEGKFRVYVARHQGVAVAASTVVIDRNSDELLGVMDKELAGPVNANDLLQATTIEHAYLAGCRFTHLGESGSSPGISHFKERFGARAYDYHEYRFERLPVSRIDLGLRRVVKRLIGFRDV